jgi:IS5 family transposase
LLLNTSKTNQQNLFYSPLSDMLDMNDPLIALANAIDWKIFENEFAGFYSKDGSPAKPIRLMVGLLILKQLENQVLITISMLFTRKKKTALSKP